MLNIVAILDYQRFRSTSSNRTNQYIPSMPTRGPVLGNRLRPKLLKSMELNWTAYFPLRLIDALRLCDPTYGIRHVCTASYPGSPQRLII